MPGRTPALFLLAFAALVPSFAANGSLDPAFAKVPFDRWFAGGEQARIRWSAHVSQPQLSIHQRLAAEVEIQMDGADLAKRRGRGRLIVFVQFADKDGALYQDHGAIELEKLEEGIKAQDITYTQRVFLTPGDYSASFALLDTATEEHTTRRERVHVTALKNDPFPEAWRNLPPVEFVPSSEPPDGWYLPSVAGRLYLPVAASHPVRIEVLVNLTPSERLAGSHRVQDRNLGVLLPALKALTQADIAGAQLNVSLLDLSRRRVVFQQNAVHELEWDKLKGSLSETDPGTIDVKSLGDRSRNAAFFVKEVSKRATGGETPRAVIVLSSPVAFEDGEDLDPIQISGPACPVFYFRMHTEGAPAAAPMPLPGGRRGGPGGFGMPHPNPRRTMVQPPLPDQLEPTLKPLAPRLYDVHSAEQFRKALAGMFAEISAL